MTRRHPFPKVDPAGLWGFVEIAEHTGMTRDTVKKLRAEMPEPVGRASGRLMWNPASIRKWSKNRQTRSSRWSRLDVERYTRRTWAELKQVPSWPQFPERTNGHWDKAPVVAWWEAHLDRDDGRWDSQDVAQQLGLSWQTVRTYRRRGDLPEPDGVDGNHPWWWPATIRTWDEARRSGSGRPRMARAHQRRWR